MDYDDIKLELMEKLAFIVMKSKAARQTAAQAVPHSKFRTLQQKAGNHYWGSSPGRVLK